MVVNQAYLFLIFVINGIVIGLLFDFFRILRKSFKTKDVVTYLEDVLFWLLTGFLLLYSVFTFNNGELRLFMFIGVLMGGILYMLTISKFVIRVNVAIILAAKNILSKVLTIIFWPFQFLYRWIKKIFFKPISFCIINFRKFSTNFAQKTRKMFQFNKNLKKTQKN